MTDDDINELREFNCAPQTDYPASERVTETVEHKRTVVRRVGRSIARSVWQSVCILGYQIAAGNGVVTEPPDALKPRQP